MAGRLVNTYSAGHSDLPNIMETLTTAFYGHTAFIALTNLTTTDAPMIKAGSVVEINSNLYKFDTDTAISLTDPITGMAVNDGVMYIALSDASGEVIAYFTNTTPTWADTKQCYQIFPGYHMKCIGGCWGTGTSYTSKFVYDGVEAMAKNIKSNITFATRTVAAFTMTEFTETIVFNSQIEAVLSVIPSFRCTSVSQMPQYGMLSDVSFTGNTLTVKYAIKNSDNSSTYTFEVSLATSIIGY